MTRAGDVCVLFVTIIVVAAAAGAWFVALSVGRLDTTESPFVREQGARMLRSLAVLRRRATAAEQFAADAAALDARALILLTAASGRRRGAVSGASATNGTCTALQWHGGAATTLAATAASRAPDAAALPAWARAGIL